MSSYFIKLLHCRVRCAQVRQLTPLTPELLGDGTRQKSEPQMEGQDSERVWSKDGRSQCESGDQRLNGQPSARTSSPMQHFQLQISQEPGMTPDGFPRILISNTLERWNQEK